MRPCAIGNTAYEVIDDTFMSLCGNCFAIKKNTEEIQKLFDRARKIGVSESNLCRRRTRKCLCNREGGLPGPPNPQ